MCYKKNKLDWAVFHSEKHFNSIDWIPNSGELLLRGAKVVPGYKTSQPFFIAVDLSCTKLVLVNTVTQDMLDIAILKRNHPHDVILESKF